MTQIHSLKDPSGRDPFKVPVHYKGHALEVNHRADFVCYNRVLVELKALKRLSGIEEAQVVNYLLATGLPTGLLVHSGAPSLQFRRFAGPRVWTSDQSVQSVKSVVAVANFE